MEEWMRPYIEILGGAFNRMTFEELKAFIEEERGKTYNWDRSPEDRAALLKLNILYSQLALLTRLHNNKLLKE